MYGGFWSQTNADPSLYTASAVSLFQQTERKTPLGKGGKDSRYMHGHIALSLIYRQTKCLQQRKKSTLQTPEGQSPPGVSWLSQSLFRTGNVVLSSLPFLFLCLARQKASKEEVAGEHVMATGELNPNHYPAQRAAKVVQHYLNARYGSPCRLFGLQRVHRGNAQVFHLVYLNSKKLASSM